MSRQNTVKLTLCCVLLILALVFYVFSLRPMRNIPLQIAGQTLRVQVAETQAQLTQGLSGTDQLLEGHGMLFAFTTSRTWQFWMKDMRYPLDIIWLDEHKQVLYIAQNLAPNTYPKLFGPDKPARYVLEVPAGYAQRYQITTSSFASFAF